MQHHRTLALALIAGALFATSPSFGQSQRGPKASAIPSRFTKPSLVTQSKGLSRPAIVRVKNRARTLGNRMSGSRTRYFAATDRSLSRHASNASKIRSLAPAPVARGDGVRRVEVVVDIRRPVTLTASRGTPVRVGTVSIAPSQTRISVHSSIYASRIKVIGK